jgi:hypothetical protein
MSSRVSIPPSLHLIGSVQPPRPRPSRVGPRGLLGRVTPRLNAASSSHALVIRVRNLSAALLFLASFGLPCGRPRRPTALKELSASPGYVLLRHMGPFDACQPTLARPSVLPCGRTPTGRDCLPRLCSHRESAGLVSCRIVHGHPPFRGFSPLAAACPSRDTLSFMPFPTSRCRGSKDVSLRSGAFS